MPTKDCHYEDTVLSPTISYLVGRFFFFQEFLIGVWKKCTPSSIQAIFIAYLLCLVLKGHNWNRDIPKDNQQGRKRKLSTNIVTLWKHTRINDFAPKVHDLSEPVLHPSLLDFFFSLKEAALNSIPSIQGASKSIMTLCLLKGKHEHRNDRRQGTTHENML